MYNKKKGVKGYEKNVLKKRMQIKEAQHQKDIRIAEAMKKYDKVIEEMKSRSVYACFHYAIINGMKIETSDKLTHICDICGCDCSVDSNPVYVKNEVAEVIDRQKLLNFSRENMEKYIAVESMNKYSEFNKSNQERRCKEPEVENVFGFELDDVGKFVHCIIPFPEPRQLVDFPQILKKMMDDRGLNKIDVYKRANIDAKLFSKMLNSPSYHPGKSTVLAIAIAMKLSISETQEFLRQVGYALSPNILSDLILIVKYCIESGFYDIYEINNLLFEYGQKLLGSKIREE